MSQHALTDRDPLWVPLLTHYRPDGGIDRGRMKAHLKSIVPHVRQIMLAGSTGDGWEMDDARFAELLEFAVRDTPKDTRIIFGALAPDAASVVARIKMVERRVADEAAFRERYLGVTVCPPVRKDATQGEILSHYEEILGETASPVAVYQLPQVTGCSIAAETLQELAENPRVTMFKDSGGGDEVTSSGRDFSRLVTVRGAEGGYVEAVTAAGYSGWLLSTANVFVRHLRQIEEKVRAGRDAEALQLSDRLSGVVAQLFEAAANESGANAFSNANRAADHLAAYGRRWREVPLPLKQDEQSLSEDMIAHAASFCAALVDVDGEGYFRA